MKYKIHKPRKWISSINIVMVIICLSGLLALTYGKSQTAVPGSSNNPSKSASNRGERQETVTGTVTDQESGNSLPGVNIRVKGTSRGASTDMEGNYSIEVPTLQDTLVFTYVGYKTRIVPINGRTEINVKLATQAVMGEEMVVVGYGEQSREDVTGSVGSVDGDDLTERQSLNIEQSLAGKVAGVNIMTNSGRPGGQTRARIRGYSSINASNEPLYVVDGVVMTSGISSLNPNNIESVEVLKDASATAIYGTRGSNGVILITTKRGETAENTLTYNGSTSISHMTRKQDVLSAEQFLKVEERAYQNAQKFDPTGWENGQYEHPDEKRKELIGTLFDENLNPLYDVDWQDRVTRTAVSQAHNLSYTGVNEGTNYGLYLGYNDEKGIIKNSYEKRYNVRGVLDSDINEWLTAGGTIKYSRNEGRIVDFFTGANNVPRMMIEMIPIVPYKYEDNSYGRRDDYPGMESGDNPLSQLHENDRRYRYNTFNGNTYLTLKPLEGLKFTSRFGTNVQNQVNPYFSSSRTRIGSSININYGEVVSSESRFWQWSNHLNYNTTIAEDHSLRATLGSELQKSQYLDWNASTNEMPDDYYKWYNLGAGSDPNAPSSNSTEWSMESYFARANYDYKNRYLLTVTGRIDGSSRFGNDNKYAFFPSAALAWRASNEEFLENHETISNLKVRLSYGLTGNSEIGEYQSKANLTTNTAIFNGQRAAGTVISTLANPELEWEKTRQFDIGFDLGLFNDRIELNGDYYYKKTTDLLLGAPVPNSSGYGSMTRNIGSMENQGVELTLNTVNVNSNNFNWTSFVNFSYSENEILSLGVNNEDIFPGPWFLSQTNIIRVGESVGSFWGLKREGTWNTDEADEAARYGKKPGDLKHKDLNNDGEINSDDYTIIGNGTPDFYGTISNTFSYKNFDATVELQYVYGNDILKLTEHSSLDRVGIANSYEEVLNAWTPDNQDTPIAQLRPTQAGYDSFIDDHKVKDGSFIRGKNFRLNYNLPSEFANKFGIGNAEVFMSVQNFFVLTKYEGYDPETTTYGDSFSQGIQFHDYPKPRTYTLGLNLKF